MNSYWDENPEIYQEPRWREDGLQEPEVVTSMESEADVLGRMRNPLERTQHEIEEEARKTGRTPQDILAERLRKTIFRGGNE